MMAKSFIVQKNWLGNLLNRKGTIMSKYWNKEGEFVAGVYLGIVNVAGTVIESRVKYGGMVQHRIKLDTPLDLFGTLRDSVSLDESELYHKFQTVNCVEA